MESGAVWPEYLAHDRVAAMMTLGTAHAEWLAEELGKLDIEGDDTVVIALAAFAVTHEHHAAILALIRSGHLGSALALLRPCFEAMVRGLWLIRGAVSDQVARYVDGKDSLAIEALLNGIAKGPSAAEDAFLRDTWTKSKASLHQYTHVSFQLLVRRMGEQLVDEPITGDEVANAIRFATATAALAAVEVGRLGKSDVVQATALKVLGKLYQG